MEQEKLDYFKSILNEEMKALLGEAGYSAAEIAAMREEGVAA